jgi:hypothetical protein
MNRAFTPPLFCKMSRTGSTPSSTKDTAPIWMPIIFFFESVVCAARAGAPRAVIAAASKNSRRLLFDNLCSLSLCGVNRCWRVERVVCRLRSCNFAIRPNEPYPNLVGIISQENRVRMQWWGSYADSSMNRWFGADGGLWARLTQWDPRRRRPT